MKEKFDAKAPTMERSEGLLGGSPGPQLVSDDAANVESQPLILVVDDDASTREAMEALLELAGYRAASASDGLEALDMLRRGMQPALILLDLNMPRLDGFSFRSIQRSMPRVASIPVVVCSGHLESPDQLSELGHVTILHKPVSVATLKEVIQRQCATPPSP